MNREKVKIFLGPEVEKTRFYGLQTLFICDPHVSMDEIRDSYDKNKCEHIYLGGNKSISENNIDDYILLAIILANKRYNITIDVTYEQFISRRSQFELFASKANFCIMIRVEFDSNLTLNSIINSISIKLDSREEIENIWVLTPSEKNKTTAKEYEKDIEIL